MRKLCLIAVSDLVTIDKLRYVLNAARSGPGLCTYQLRGGVSIALRIGTTDSKVFDEIFIERAYARFIAVLPDHLGRVTLIDLGANIGLSALYIAKELEARALEIGQIIAVEPDPDNFRLLSENLRRSGLAALTTAIPAFVGAERSFAEQCDSGNGAWGMRMGALSNAGIPVLPLAEIAGAAKTCSAKTNATLVLKCDIEGGERQLFLHIRDWEHLIRYIVLELHTEFLSVEELFACLESSGYRWIVHGTPPAGASIALFLLERGEQP